MEECRVNIRETGEGVILSVHVIPKSKKEGLAGQHGDSIKLKVNAPPVEGAANKAVVKFLAKLFGVPKSSIEIIRGETGREKQVLIRGLGLEEAEEILSKATGG
jgi:uncharacterized protein (TIGR00251 family)